MRVIQELRVATGFGNKKLPEIEATSRHSALCHKTFDSKTRRLVAGCPGSKRLRSARRFMLQRL